MSQGASAINDPVLGAGGRQGRELQQLIRSGRSFSGRERNCFFLNTGQSVGGTPRFANLGLARKAPCLANEVQSYLIELHQVGV